MPAWMKQEISGLIDAWVPIAEETNSIAWEIASNSKSTPQRAAVAVAAIEEVLRSSPWNADIVNTLGVAQYRAGQYAAALGTLARSSALYAKTGKQQPADAAFIAMSHFKL